jgi:hypothetical protein
MQRSLGALTSIYEFGIFGLQIREKFHTLFEVRLFTPDQLRCFGQTVQVLFPACK